MGEVDGHSLQQRVQAARRRRQDNAVVHVPIPGYQDTLIGRYKAVDWQTRVDINLALEGQTGRRSVLLWGLAADHLIASCEGVEAHLGEETADLGMTYGRELGEWLGLDMEHVENPREALALIIEDGEDLIEHFSEVRKEQAEGSDKLDRDIAGESHAAS